MIGRDNETLKPLKWLKIENSETDEEDSALGISSGASSSSELGQERFFMMIFCLFVFIYNILTIIPFTFCFGMN